MSQLPLRKIFYLKGFNISTPRKANITVQVNSNVERALRQLKKKIEREGVVRDMKRTVYFESPTQKRRKRLVRAIKQNLLRQINQFS
jgi:small subunit ribosomal protein S21